MHPVLFEIGWLKIYSYGVCLTLGFFVSLWLCKKELRQQGLDWSSTGTLLAIAAFVGLFGSKLLYVLVALSRENSLRDPSLWLGSGFVLYGVPLFGLPVFYWLTIKSGLPSWKLLDIVCLSFLPAHAIGRIGCFLAGCCHGKPTDSIFGMRFPSPFADLTARFLYVHPVQLYESGGVIVIFLILLFMHRRQSLPGVITGSYLIAYGTLRFILEFFRGDGDRGELALLSTSQWISIGFLAAGIMLIARHNRAISRP